MRLLHEKTLDGKTINSSYYKGHVTIVSFMYIGCPPCMHEIYTLNRINDEYRNRGVQVLCVARQTRDQMEEFNCNRALRKTYHADSIRYSIQPGCESKTEKDISGKMIIKNECRLMKEKFDITGYPTNFFVDKKGIVRSIHMGGPVVTNDPDFYDSIKNEVDSLLAEP
jgi:peroxiredoxin